MEERVGLGRVVRGLRDPDLLADYTQGKVGWEAGRGGGKEP